MTKLEFALDIVCDELWPTLLELPAKRFLQAFFSGKSRMWYADEERKLTANILEFIELLPDERLRRYPAQDDRYLLSLFAVNLANRTSMALRDMRTLQKQVTDRELPVRESLGEACLNVLFFRAEALRVWPYDEPSPLSDDPG